MTSTVPSHVTLPCAPPAAGAALRVRVRICVCVCTHARVRARFPVAHVTGWWWWVTRRSRDRAAGPCRSRGCARHGLLLQQRGRGLRPGGPGAGGTRSPRRGRCREGRSAAHPPAPGLPGRGWAVGARRFPAAGQCLSAAPACRRPRVTRSSLVSRCLVCPPGAAWLLEAGARGSCQTLLPSRCRCKSKASDGTGGSSASFSFLAQRDCHAAQGPGQNWGCHLSRET